MGLPPPRLRIHKDAKDEPKLQVHHRPIPNQQTAILIFPQHRPLQNSHLDHPPDPHPPYFHPHPARLAHRPPLRRRNRLPMGSRVHQVPRAAREDLAVDREQAQLAWKTAALCECGSEDVWKIWRTAEFGAVGRASGWCAAESRRGAETWAVR